MTNTNMGFKDKDFALNYFKVGLESVHATTKTFIEKLTEDMPYAMGWCDRMLECAAEVKTLSWAIAKIEKGELTRREMMNFAKKEAIQRAASTSQSTSQITNMLRQCEMAAWAKMGLFLERCED